MPEIVSKDVNLNISYVNNEIDAVFMLIESDTGPIDRWIKVSSLITFYEYFNTHKKTISYNTAIKLLLLGYTLYLVRVNTETTYPGIRLFSNGLYSYPEKSIKYESNIVVEDLTIDTFLTKTYTYTLDYSSLGLGIGNDSYLMLNTVNPNFTDDLIYFHENLESDKVVCDVDGSSIRIKSISVGRGSKLTFIKIDNDILSTVGILEGEYSGIDPNIPATVTGTKPESFNIVLDFNDKLKINIDNNRERIVIVNPGTYTALELAIQLQSKINLSFSNKIISTTFYNRSFMITSSDLSTQLDSLIRILKYSMGFTVTHDKDKKEITITRYSLTGYPYQCNFGLKVTTYQNINYDVLNRKHEKRKLLDFFTKYPGNIFDTKINIYKNYDDTFTIIISKLDENEISLIRESFIITLNPEDKDNFIEVQLSKSTLVDVVFYNPGNITGEFILKREVTVKSYTYLDYIDKLRSMKSLPEYAFNLILDSNINHYDYHKELVERFSKEYAIFLFSADITNLLYYNKEVSGLSYFYSTYKIEGIEYPTYILVLIMASTNVYSGTINDNIYPTETLLVDTEDTRYINRIVYKNYTFYLEEDYAFDLNNKLDNIGFLINFTRSNLIAINILEQLLTVEPKRYKVEFDKLKLIYLKKLPLIKKLELKDYILENNTVTLIMNTEILTYYGSTYKLAIKVSN